MDWQPERYDAFAGPRQRAARDLLAGVALQSCHCLWDLGCGSGLSTALAAERWPQARIIAVDSSASMLERARERLPAAEFVQADIATFAADASDAAPDLIVANASLHWLPDHRTLLPRLLAALRPGGILAVQMPNNSGEPSHRLMQRVAAAPAYRDLLSTVTGTRHPLLPPEDYYDCLAPLAADLTLWETRYLHALDGAQAIADWFASTALRPLLAALPDPLAAQFRADYVAALEHAYPPRADGRVLLAMPRLFLVVGRRH